jgi:hypothetical protein
MPPSRIGVPLFPSLLLAGPLPAEDSKPATTATTAATAATAEELFKNPQVFHGKLVRVEWGKWG